MIHIDKHLIDDLFEKAKASERKRMNYDLRTSPNDGSQRMLNALMPGSVVPIHRHPHSNENVLLLCGKLIEVLYNDNGKETERIHLDPSIGNFGCIVPANTWHTVEVLEPSVIYEAKDGKYGEDGSEDLSHTLPQREETIDEESQHDTSEHFSNSLGDLMKNIEYLIGMERQSGSMEVITPLYISRMLNVPLEEVEQCIRDNNLL